MRKHLLEAELWLPLPPEELFSFFAEARNLETLTPPWLRFTVLSPSPIEMRAGTMIDYKLRIHGIPVRWQSEITVWEPPFRFADEQRRGPYRRWMHLHTFEERAGGTLCKDHVEYSVWGGVWANRLLVRDQVEEIFSYRKKTLRSLFHGGVSWP